MNNKKETMDKNGQQEIVGFVLIVVVVIIGLMVFLLVFLGNKNTEIESFAVQNMISAIFKTTSKCAVSFEPQFDDYEALFKSCKAGERCNNLNVNTCDYLNTSLGGVIKSLISTEASINAYKFDFLEKDSNGESGILTISEGRCNSTRQGAQRAISYRGETLIVRVSVC